MKHMTRQIDIDQTSSIQEPLKEPPLPCGCNLQVNLVTRVTQGAWAGPLGPAFIQALAWTDRHPEHGSFWAFASHSHQFFREM